MSPSSKIALIGLNLLESVGMRSILAESGGRLTESFSDFKDFESLADRIEIYIISAEICLHYLDFFLPRKSRTLVVDNSQRVRDVKGSFSMISVFADESDIKEGIERFLNSLEGTDIPGDLSVREKEVLRLIAEGKINKEIADELCISINTVITHRKNISAKLGIKSASGLSLYAVMNGII